MNGEQVARQARKGFGREAAIFFGGMAAIRALGLAEWRAFWPQRSDFDTPDNTEDVWIRTPDGVRLHAWFMPATHTPPGGRAPAVLHAHGSAGNLSQHARYTRFLTERGFHVLLFDYRGYGRSDPCAMLGRPAVVRDTRAALATLLARGDVDPDRVGTLGMSIGACFALDAAVNEPRVRSVVSVSGFASWKRMAARVIPFFGPQVVANGVDSERLIRRLGDREALLLHGLQDEIVPFAHAEQLAEAARSAGVRAQLSLHPEADHNNLVIDLPEARDTIAEFFERTLAPTSSPASSLPSHRPRAPQHAAG